MAFILLENKNKDGNEKTNFGHLSNQISNLYSGQVFFLIPSINRPSIINAVNSLLNQTNPNWECIIIYDGVDGFKFDDDRIKIVVTEKLGGSSSFHGISGLVRNVGLNMVNTDWIGFLDDDDTLDSNYVHTLFTKYNDYDFIIWKMKYANGMATTC